METLTARLVRGGAIAEADAVGWIIRLARTIEQIHARLGEHGRVSADALLMEEDSRISAGHLVDYADLPANPAYHSPERTRGGGASQTDDTWALAVTLYFALSGSLPFSGTNLDEVRRKVVSVPAPPLAVFDVGDDDLQTIVDGALAANPVERTCDLSELRRLLEGWLSGQGGFPPEALPPLGDDEEEVTMIQVGIPASLRHILDGVSAPASAPTDTLPKLAPPPASAPAQSPVIAFPSANAPAQSPAPAPPPASAPAQSPAPVPAPPPEPVRPSYEPAAPEAPTTLRESAPEPPAPPAAQPAGAPERESPIGFYVAAVLLGLGIAGAAYLVLDKPKGPSDTSPPASIAPAVPARPAPPSPPPTPHPSVAVPPATAPPAASPPASAPPAPAASASAAPPPSASASAAPVSGAPADATACARSFFPPDSFGASPDFAFVCTEADPIKGAAGVRAQLVRSGKNESEGMREWALLGWYELPAFSVLRSRCCPSPPPLKVAEVPASCAPVRGVLGAIDEAVASAPDVSDERLKKAVDAYTHDVYCIVRTGLAARFGRVDNPQGGEDTEFWRFLGRVLKAKR